MQPSKQPRQLVRLRHQRRSASIQDIPDGLLLWQNHPTLRRRFVNGRHQNDGIAAGDQVAHKANLLSLRGKLAQQLLTLRDI